MTFGKVAITSSGYDPNGPRVSDPTLQLDRLPTLTVYHRESDGSSHLYEAGEDNPAPFYGHVASWLTKEYAAEIVRRCNAYPELLKVAACLDAMDLCEGDLFNAGDWPKLRDATAAARGVLKSLSGDRS